MTKLMIVESPSKSKTIEKYLGNDFDVVSSKGHICDLAIKGKGGLGVDVDNDFAPTYVINPDKKDVVADLKKRVKKADEVLLATDNDREGEAISWHLARVLGLDMDSKNRIVFQEVTKPAIVKAIANPRQIDMNMVKSQEDRRILDRIIGFKLSSLLQRKIKSKSAGRVQSVALKLICDREKEVKAFVPAEYWTVEAAFEKQDIAFTAPLTKIENKAVDAKDRHLITTQQQAEEIKKACQGPFTVGEVKKEVKTKGPRLPYITSTLQQDASNKLNFTSKRTMSVAQKLYEGIAIGTETTGLITYMRTDSNRLSDVFMAQTKDFIAKNYGADYAGYYHAKVDKNAQDAHEAIRPTNIENTPEKVKAHLTAEEYKLYSMIYYRALAALMAPARYDAVTVRLLNGIYEYTASGRHLLFDGYQKVYGAYENSGDDVDLPELQDNEAITAQSIEAKQHFTEPPLRYSEARLIKAMEEYGIGRPSTYATIIDTILMRGYVEYLRSDDGTKSKVFVPTEQGDLTNDKLAEYFSSIINVKYTADMESELDSIAEGQCDPVEALHRFYDEFSPLVDNAYENMEKKEPVKTGEKCPECGGDLVIRQGRYGEFISCSNYPTCKFVKKKPEDEPVKTGEKCPECGNDLVIRQGRYGKFISCSNYPACKYVKKLPEDEPVDTGEICPQCGHHLVRRKSRYGTYFVGCSNYPACKYIKPDPNAPARHYRAKKGTAKKKATK